LALLGICLLVTPIRVHGGGHGGGGWHHGGWHHGGFYHGGVFIYAGGFYPGYWGFGYGPGYWGYDSYPPTCIVTAPQVVYQPSPSASPYPPTPIPKEPIPPPNQKTPIPTPQVDAETGTTGEPNAPPLLAVTNTVSISTQASSQPDSLVGQLTQADEATRSAPAIQLGRMKATSAVASLSNVLAKDTSATVRDSAARALGLIGSPSSLNALTRAAQADDDREVRRSSQFAVDLIRWNLHGK
jgi:hypothetical protein